jgi:hypothetical protein
MIVVLLLSAVITARAIDVYVDPISGSDTPDSGSPASPFRTVPYALYTSFQASATEVEVYLSPSIFSYPNECVFLDCRAAVTKSVSFVPWTFVFVSSDSPDALQ